ncbi:unnamed protein product, partial [Ascophyllum nodosum]
MGYDGSPDGSWDPVTGLGTINYQGRAQRMEPRVPKHEPQHLAIDCRSW